MMYHEPVLLKESIEGLKIREGGIYVDATYGGGGHSKEILKRLGKGSLIVFDRDKDALANKPVDDRLIFINNDFRYMRNFLKLFKLLPVDGVLADLGVSSHQFDQPERGFSIRFDAELDLRMDRSKPLSAKEVVNQYPVHKLKDIFEKYGELKNAGGIAQMIEKARKEGEITTTGRLKEVLKRAAVKGKENKFFAKVFQALRIEVNDELGSLKEMLRQAPDIIRPGGRLVVISYHSLEDRIVKNFIKAGNFEGKVDKDFYGNPLTPFKPVNRKPIIPADEEILRNNRARSAKLRIAEKK